MSATAIKLPVTAKSNGVYDATGSMVAACPSMKVSYEIAIAVAERPALLADVKEMREALKGAAVVLAILPIPDDVSNETRAAIERRHKAVLAALASKED